MSLPARDDKQFFATSTRVAGAERQDTRARGKQLNAGREAMNGGGYLPPVLLSM